MGSRRASSPSYRCISMLSGSLWVIAKDIVSGSLGLLFFDVQ
jgi:hypothetical protein